MDAVKAVGPGDAEWTDAQACRLPTAERPLRLAEFDDLFTSLHLVEWAGGNCARLLLVGDVALADRAQRLTDAESSCCSFFTFDVSMHEGGVVALDIEVPPAYVDVLAGLVARAEASRAVAS